MPIVESPSAGAPRSRTPRRGWAAGGRPGGAGSAGAARPGEGSARCGDKATEV